MIRATHTHVILEVSSTTFREVHDKLTAAGYGHAIMQEDGKSLIDMHGLALGIDQPLSAFEGPAKT